MEEKRGRTGCTLFQVWVESEEGARVCMKRLVFGSLVFMISVSIAWAWSLGLLALGPNGEELLWL